MRRCWMIFLAAGGVCGCSTPKLSVYVDDAKTTCNVSIPAEQGKEQCAVSVENSSGIIAVSCAPDQRHEHPTLRQMSTWADLVFDEYLRPKLEDNEDLSDAELTILACCLNIRIARMKAMTTQVVNAIDVDPSSVTYGMVAHPKITAASDFGAGHRWKELEQARCDSEKGFKEFIDAAIDEELRCETTSGMQIKKWGESFSGNENKNLTCSLDRADRNKVLRHVLKNEPFDVDDMIDPHMVLKKVANRVLAISPSWFQPRNMNDVKDVFERHYESLKSRKRNLGWRESYLDSIVNLRRMYEASSYSSTNKVIMKSRQADRLGDLMRQNANAIKRTTADAEALVVEYQVGVTMIECVRLMQYFYQRSYNKWDFEWLLTEYKKIGKAFTDYVKSQNVNDFQNETLKYCYRKYIAEFFEDRLDKSQDGLWSEGVIPFKPERNK